MILVKADRSLSDATRLRVPNLDNANMLVPYNF